MSVNLNKDNYPYLLEKATALYKKSRSDSLDDFPKEIRDEFQKSGNRTNFEKLYFNRRDYLSATAILALFDDSYIAELEKIIIAICSEESWLLPAHTIHGENFVDLFIAETSFALSEISAVFADKLSPYIHGRIKSEIRERLIERYSEETFWWENCNMNWASVCAGFIGGTLLYLFPDDFKRHKKRILKTLGCYIDGFTDDGFCLEGPSYWLYGFTAYSVFADLLYKFTDGKEDLFLSDKVSAVASYGEKCLLTDTTSLSFSDADESFRMDFALKSFLHQKYPHMITYPNSKDTLYDANTKWITYYRAIIWQKAVSGVPVHKSSEIYSPFANQLIVKKDRYSFAFKGGNNDEPHNHNDLGSFIYADKDGQVFCDLGAGRYTKDYFDESKRYSIFCNSSASHSVPIIGGNFQKAGKDFSAVLTYDNGTATCPMTKAYDCQELLSLVRKAQIKESSVIISDTFETSQSIPLTERFVSKRKADLKDGVLIFGKTKMVYPVDKATLKVTAKNHTPHEYDTEDETVYCYDFLLNEAVTEISFEIITE